MAATRTTLLLAAVLSAACLQAQGDNQQLATSNQQPFDTLRVTSNYLGAVSSRAGRLEAQLDHTTAKALAQFQKQEEKLHQKLARTDSTKAKALIAESRSRYEALQRKLSSQGAVNQYFPGLDTLSSSISFLQQNPEWLNKVPAGQLTATMDKLQGMEDKFQQAEQVRQFLNERKQYLKERLGGLGFAKQLKNINKQAYYYSAQLNEYKSLLKDHKKAARKGIELLSKSKAFQDFMRRHSRLASLFRVPDPNDPASAISLAGLQTRAQVNTLIQQQVAAGGPNALAQVQQNMQDAQSQLNQLKEKLLKTPGAIGNGGDADMPEGFRPNNQKTKSFLKRLEFGTNIQSQQSTGLLPAYSDLGVSVGYKLSDKSIIGIGGSYKLGWGKDIRHIRISHQGLSLRSFVDWQLKGSFWLSGGYELNYRSEFRQIEELKDLNAWQPSGLIGVSKLISLKTKLLKQTKLLLLWDFLSYRQAPRAQPVVFRIGYTF